MCKILHACFLHVNPPLLYAIYMGHMQMLQLKPLSEQFSPLIMYNSAPWIQTHQPSVNI